MFIAEASRSPGRYLDKYLPTVGWHRDISSLTRNLVDPRSVACTRTTCRQDQQFGLIVWMHFAHCLGNHRRVPEDALDLHEHLGVVFYMPFPLVPARKGQSVTNAPYSVLRSNTCCTKWTSATGYGTAPRRLEKARTTSGLGG